MRVDHPTVFYLPCRPTNRGTILEMWLLHGCYRLYLVAPHCSRCKRKDQKERVKRSIRSLEPQAAGLLMSPLIGYLQMSIRTS